MTLDEIKAEIEVLATRWEDLADTYSDRHLVHGCDGRSDGLREALALLETLDQPTVDIEVEADDAPPFKGQVLEGVLVGFREGPDEYVYEIMPRLEEWSSTNPKFAARAESPIAGLTCCDIGDRVTVSFADVFAAQGSIHRKTPPPEWFKDAYLSIGEHFK